MKAWVYFANVFGVMALFSGLVWPFNYFFLSSIGSHILYSFLEMLGVTVFGEPGDQEITATVLCSFVSAILTGFAANQFFLRCAARRRLRNGDASKKS